MNEDLFRIEMLPAGYGDCLWIEYGDPHEPSRVLIDAGTLPTYKTLRRRLLALPKDRRQFELLVLTHVDTDHIDGAVRLLNSPSLEAEWGDVWFNSWAHLPSDKLGPVQGEIVGALLTERQIAWNRAFGGEAVVVPAGGPLPTATLPGGMRLTLLSPGIGQLRKLVPEWEKVLRAAGLVPGSPKEALAALAEKKKYADTLGGPKLNVGALGDTSSKIDTAAANGSSIAFLAEYGGRRCLFGADANPVVLAAGIDRLLALETSSRLRLDAYKVAHHGSRHNTTIELIEKLQSARFLISTDGKLFHHPDREGVARIVRHAGGKPHLYFNYRSPETEIWADPALGRKYGYSVSLPAAGEAGLVVEL